MKRFVFSNFFAAGILCCLLMNACSKYTEIDFSGVVIDTRACSNSVVKPDLGYLVNISSPDSIGSSYTLANGTTYRNVVILYAPDRLIYLGDHLSGSFYFDDEYPRANCSIHWNDIDQIPIGVFTAVTVD